MTQPTGKINKKAAYLAVMVLAGILILNKFYPSLQQRPATTPVPLAAETPAIPTAKPGLCLELHVPDAQAYDPMILWLEALCNPYTKKIYRDYELFTRVIGNATGQYQPQGQRRLFIIRESRNGLERVELKELEKYGKYANSFNDYVLSSLDEFLAAQPAD